MSVFICTVPRTGSQLLAHLLWRSGAVGFPNEWFWRDVMACARAAWGTTTWSEYLGRVLEEGTSATGVFAAKVMWGYMHELLVDLRRLRQYDADDLAVLRSFFPDPRFVWLRRTDFVAQAVSFAKATQTSQWTAYQSATAEAKFDFQQIEDLYRVVRAHDRDWRRWFAAHGIEPYRVVYEELAAAPEQIGREVLAALGLELQPGGSLDAPPELTPQADAVNAAWSARYRQLAGLDR
jgi:LPS sulfotransferase NodH